MVHVPMQEAKTTYKLLYQTKDTCVVFSTFYRRLTKGEAPDMAIRRRRYFCVLATWERLFKNRRDHVQLQIFRERIDLGIPPAKAILKRHEHGSFSVGKKFGRLTVTKIVGQNKHYQSIVEAFCECGITGVFALHDMKAGKIWRCGKDCVLGDKTNANK